MTPLPRWADLILVPLVSVLAAFFIAGLVVFAIGANPLEATRILLAGSLGSSEAIGFTLYYATNFIFTGLAVAVAFHAGLFNIGGEGQAYISGLGLALICLNFGFLPAYILLPLAVLAAMLAGAAWAAIPAYLQAKRGSHIVITTIMFNLLASALMSYLLVNVLRPAGAMQPGSEPFPPSAQMPKMDMIFGWLGMKISPTPLNLSFALALLACLVVWILLWRTRLGYRIRTVGIAPRAADYAGISPARMMIIAMLISGALASGLAVNAILGEQNVLLLDFTSGYGFVGIAVALMGRSHPVGIILASLLFGALYQGGTELGFEVPKITRDMILLIQGLVVLFAGGLEGWFRPQIARLLRLSRWGNPP